MMVVTIERKMPMNWYLQIAEECLLPGQESKLLRDYKRAEQKGKLPEYRARFETTTYQTRLPV